MKDEALAETLGVHVVLSTAAADAWHRVVHGQLSPDDAVQQLPPGDDRRRAIAQVMQGFAPPGGAARQERFETLVARLARQRDADERGAAVVPMQRHRARRGAVGLLAAAAAAVLVVWLRDPGPFAGGYVFELERAVVAMRDEPKTVAGIPTFLVDGELVMRLVPEDVVDEPVGVVAFGVGREGEPRRLEVAPVVHANGVVEIEASMQTLGLGRGEWELVIAVGRVRALPTSWAVLEEAEAAGNDGFEVVRTRVRVVERR